MRRPLAIVLSLALTLSLGVGASAQDRPSQPLYKITINVVERTAKAINYRARGGSTTIGFQGTPLMPKSNGEAKVESKQGYIEIEVEFDDLEPATRYGPEFLTYVMWAVSPEGRAVNLGEVILNGNRSKLNVTTDLQSFGLIVTAEPYFAVTQPSDVVVMENYVRGDTRGRFEEIDAKYQLLQRGQYTTNVLPSELKPLELDSKIPLDLYQARNAVRIARWAAANKDAADTFSKAELLLREAEVYREEKKWRQLSMSARQAVQTAEDGRLIALKVQEEARLEAERRASADREDRARDAAQAETERRAQAEREQRLEAERRAQAEREQRLESERRARAEAEAAAVQAQARVDAERAAQERASIAAEAERARQAAEQARLAADQAERDKQLLRQQLTEQLNLILDTRDSARGLIVNMSDVLFDFNKYTLKPGAREKLAKVAGIVLAHPGLSLEVEGHTDSVGSDEYNQRLSEQRAGAVRDFLVQQGIKSNITAKGFGEASPVATNDTASGRQQNRRVEMIVSGEVIGNPRGPTSSLPR